MGDDGPSGGAPTGGNDSGGGADSGGAQSGGGTSGTGGEGNGGSGGEGGEGAGGDETGGTGGGDGGTTGGGGTGGGDGGSGGTGGGTGGAPPSVLDLVDDLSSGQLIFASDNFNGEWTRYAQSSGITWDPLDMEDAIVDDDGNNVLHVKATFTVSDWGVDIVLPLFSGSSYDISDYDGIRFRAMREPGAPSTGLRLAIEDEASHRGSTLCTAGTGGTAGYQEPDCDNHAVRPALVPLAESWGEFNLLLSSIAVLQGVSGAREVEFDPTQVYAIHFQMDPSGTNPVDFWLDDIYLYKN